MYGLWKRTFELFRGHFVLWCPETIAAVAMLVLDRLARELFPWLTGFFRTQRSVLGGTAPTGDFGLASHRAMMVVNSVALAKNFVEICLFVVALVTTEELVSMLLQQRRPEMIAAVRSVLPRYRAVMLFSIKYMVCLGVLGVVLIFLGSSPATPVRVHEIALSKPFTYGLGLVAQAFLAWLLIPSTIRLLRPPGSPNASTEERGIGTIFAVVTSAASLAVQYLLGKAEAAFVPDSQWELSAFAIVNTVLINAPMVILFIALSLLAAQELPENESAAPQPEPG